MSENQSTPRDELVGKIIIVKIRVLRAARNFAKVMAEFDGQIQYCGEAMEEVIDAADRLIELEAVKEETYGY